MTVNIRFVFEHFSSCSYYCCVYVCNWRRWMVRCIHYMHNIFKFRWKTHKQMHRENLIEYTNETNKKEERKKQPMEIKKSERKRVRFLCVNILWILEVAGIYFFFFFYHSSFIFLFFLISFFFFFLVLNYFWNRV